MLGSNPMGLRPPSLEELDRSHGLGAPPGSEPASDGDTETKSIATPPSLRLSSTNEFSRRALENQPSLLLVDEDANLFDFNGDPPRTGGLCETYIAVYRPSSLQLAMKRPKSALHSQDGLRRFRREAGVWTAVRHPNILPCFGTIKVRDWIYLVSPWRQRGSLLAFVQRRIKLILRSEGLSGLPLPYEYRHFSEAKTIRGVAAGLEYLHSIGLVHGGMKAKNVLLDDEGCAQICDFGLIKSLGHAPGFGGARWQGPEVWKDLPQSSKSDVFAFGMMISEVLTGNLPFPHLDEQTAVMLAILMREERPAPQPSSRLGVDFTPLWNISAVCWKAGPGDRPCMQKVLERLELTEAILIAPNTETLDSANQQAGTAVEVDPPQLSERHEAQGWEVEPTAPLASIRVRDAIENCHLQTSTSGYTFPTATDQHDAPYGSQVAQFTMADDSTTPPAPGPSTWTEAASPFAAPQNKIQVKLRLSDEDLHLLDFPNAPPVAGGGFCELYIATHRPDGVQLAMKSLKVGFPTEEMLRRFRREAKTWSEFEHINILPFLGIMDINARIYMVSAWMTLGDLLEFVQTRIKLFELQPNELIPLVYFNFNELKTAREIAAGLGYLHSIGAIHGDMKGRNVLLNNEGRAQICDFGLTKTLDIAVTSTEQKGVGSVRWQSPELFQGEPKSVESDVYAFGMTIAEMLTASPPFPNLQIQSAVIAAVLLRNERPVQEPTLRQGIDFRPLWSLAAECWETTAGDRPSMTAILQYMDLLKLPTADHQNDEAVLRHYAVALQQLRATSSRSPRERQSELVEPPQSSETPQYTNLD